LRSTHHAKGDVDELFFRIGCQGLADLRFMESVVGQGAAHLIQRSGKLGRREAGAGGELAGTVKLSIDGGAGGAVHADGSDKCARRSPENQRDSTVHARACHVDGFVEAGCKELAHAFSRVFRIERSAFGLRQVAGEGIKPGGRHALERNAPDRKPAPWVQGASLGFGSQGLGGCRCFRAG
jgi:hypothetical protein